YYSFFSALLIVATIFFLRSFEWAIFTADGIIIQCIFGRLNYLKWTEIESITKEKKETYNSRGAPIYEKWLIIRKTNGYIEKAGFNKKNKNIVWIISNEKNVEIIKAHSKKYQNIKLKI
ncbi:MAG: hypothetical protein IKA72_02335, partial [Clostridia bacterium]|nr:hypothetical protein [Clostridia bacterium]